MGLLYAKAGGEARRTYMRSFAAACVAAALVLLSAPLFGTAWAGPWAAVVPVAAGLLFGGGSLGWRRLAFVRRRGTLSRRLAMMDLDASRPAKDGLSAYYDAQLVLLRSEYEFLIARGARGSALMFEESFGFTPEDPFESGPLDVAPDTPRMRELRERWESRISARRAAAREQPALGLREDRAYRVFPREMTVSMELATRKAYLEISRGLFKQRYGRFSASPPEEIERRAEKDLREYEALTRRNLTEPTQRPDR